jgi:hypothetical protein
MHNFKAKTWLMPPIGPGKPTGQALDSDENEQKDPAPKMSAGSFDIMQP